MLDYLQHAGFHFEVDEVFTFNAARDRERIILTIAWFSPEQIRLTRRFVSRRLIESDATFNSNDRGLLLQDVIGIDNTGKTFPIMHLFHVNEAARFFHFVRKVLATYFFYDCPGPAVWCGDFAAGLTAAIAQVAAEEALSKGKELARDSPNPLEMDPLPTAPPYELDSQTIIVDPIAHVEDTVSGPDGRSIILQRCEWHAVEAIKRKLIHKGYPKSDREGLYDLVWKWVKSMDLDLLDTARDNLILDLKVDEKEYLTGYYQLKEHSFCRAYTRLYPNLGIHSTQRNEVQHIASTKGLSKHIPVAKAAEIICERLKKLPKEYDDRINKDRVSYPRLIDKGFFKLVMYRMTEYCLKMAMVEYAHAKNMLDELESNQEDFEFDTTVGCQINCELPIQQGIPYRC